MITILRDLVVKRVDLVDLGENQAADIVLFKRRDRRREEVKDVLKPETIDLSRIPEDERPLVEALRQRAAEADAADARANAADARAKTAEERALAAEKDRDELRQASETPEAVEKARLAALPDDIRKRLEASEAEIARMREERDTAEYVGKARALPLHSTTPESFGPLLRRIATGTTTAADADEVARVVKAMGELIRVSDAFGERGRSGGATQGDAYEEARALAKAKVEAGQFATVEKALPAVWSERPELWKRYRAEETEARR